MLDPIHMANPIQSANPRSFAPRLTDFREALEPSMPPVCARSHFVRARSLARRVQALRPHRPTWPVPVGAPAASSAVRVDARIPIIIFIILGRFC